MTDASAPECLPHDDDTEQTLRDGLFVCAACGKPDGIGQSDEAKCPDCTAESKCDAHWCCAGCDRAAPAGAAADDGAVEALAERICRTVHPTRWEYRATSHPCDDVCLPAAGAVAEHVEQQAGVREVAALGAEMDAFLDDVRRQAEYEIERFPDDDWPPIALALLAALDDANARATALSEARAR